MIILPIGRRTFTAPRARSTSQPMQAEQLIALEAVLADLSALYPVIRGFAALRERAEEELLPLLSNLGAHLRSLRRKQQLDDEAVMTAVTQILGESARWSALLDEVRRSAPYQTALAAWHNNDQAALKNTVPLVFAGYRAVACPAALVFPLPIVRPPRRAGTSPFLSTGECVRQIESVLAAGIRSAADPGPWWETDLPPVACAAHPQELGSCVALRKLSGSDAPAVFAAADETTLRIFAPVIHGPFTIVLAAQPEDEWWEAYEHSYSEFRARLQCQLEQRGHVVEPDG